MCTPVFIEREETTHFIMFDAVSNLIVKDQVPPDLRYNVQRPDQLG